MKIKVLAALSVILVLGTDAHANNFSGLSWSIGQTMDESQQFIDQLSGRGAGLEWRNQTSRSVSVSLYLGWNVFNEKGEGTLSLDGSETEAVGAAAGADISGTWFRYQNIWPIMVGGQLYLGKRGNLRPYVGANVGTYAIETRVEVGLYAFQQTNWHLGAAPEVGLLLPMGESELYVYGRYNYAAEQDGRTETWATINIGIAHVERLF